MDDLGNLLVIGLSNGLIIALIALGYTIVYGIVELINFAHGDLFMLGGFAALTLIGLAVGAAPVPGSADAWLVLATLLLLVPAFGAGLNWTIDRLVYRPIRGAPKLTALVSAIGTSFILINLGLFWSGMPLPAFGEPRSPKKSVPDLLPAGNLLPEGWGVALEARHLLVFAVTIPLLIALTWLVKRTAFGRAMRASAQNPLAAKLMGIDTERVIGRCFALGGALAGVAAVVYAQYNRGIDFQMGYRAGMDAFTAAVIGGIGNLPGAVLGGVLIGVVRAFSDYHLSPQTTSIIVFSVLILLLIFRPSGLLGSRVREKV